MNFTNKNGCVLVSRNFDRLIMKVSQIISSICNWGYKDNFKPVYLYFFSRKDFKRKKGTKCKTSDFYPLRSLCAQKIVAFVVFVFTYFALLVGGFFVSVFMRAKLFRKKKNRSKIIFVTSITYTTRVNADWGNSCSTGFKIHL